MSAPMSHDPLAVNTADGACWERRAVTSEGRGLYAAAGSCGCPEFLLVPLAELAEHGIVGHADALPMPVGSEPSELERLRARVAELEAERHSTNEALDDAVQALRADRFFLADVDGANPTLWRSESAAREHCEAVLGTEVSGRSFDWVPQGDVIQLVFVDGLTDRVRAAGSAWVWPLPVSPAAEGGCTCPDTGRVEPHDVDCPEADAPCPVDGPLPGVGPDSPEMREVREALTGSPDRLTSVFVPVASLREPDGEFHGLLHHDYRVGHDLPETGGNQ